MSGLLCLAGTAHALPLLASTESATMDVEQKASAGATGSASVFLGLGTAVRLRDVPASANADIPLNLEFGGAYGVSPWMYLSAHLGVLMGGIDWLTRSDDPQSTQFNAFGVITLSAGAGAVEYIGPDDMSLSGGIEPAIAIARFTDGGSSCGPNCVVVREDSYVPDILSTWHFGVVTRLRYNFVKYLGVEARAFWAYPAYAHVMPLDTIAISLYIGGPPYP